MTTNIFSEASRIVKYINDDYDRINREMVQYKDKYNQESKDKNKRQELLKKYEHMFSSIEQRYAMFEDTDKIIDTLIEKLVDSKKKHAEILSSLNEMKVIFNNIKHEKSLQSKAIDKMREYHIPAKNQKEADIRDFVDLEESERWNNLQKSASPKRHSPSSAASRKGGKKQKRGSKTRKNKK